MVTSYGMLKNAKPKKLPSILLVLPHSGEQVQKLHQLNCYDSWYIKKSSTIQFNSYDYVIGKVEFLNLNKEDTRTPKAWEFLHD